MSTLTSNALKKELVSLRTLGLGELRQKYQQVFGESTRAGNKDFLAKGITWRMQSLADGPLSERARQRASELARDADLRTTIPRSPKSDPAHSSNRQAHAVRFSGGDAILPGTVLTREYRGRTIVVTVLPEGFEYDGTVYRSLSAVAKAVTGSHWNGRLFFNLGKAGGKGGGS